MNGKNVAHQLLPVLFVLLINLCQAQSAAVNWIRPDRPGSAQMWGIKNGIVFSIWPNPIETAQQGSGGPRGLLRVGYEFKGRIYQFNFIAVEPVVNGKMEFSEISPSRVDQKWGKIMWAANDNVDPGFQPHLPCSGTVTHPDPSHPRVEELSVYLFMEQFLNGAFPYLRVSIRSDRPEEICIQIFDQDSGTQMDRCALTATMGNYGRLRLLHLKNKVVDSRVLYRGYNGIDFIEKEGYASSQLWRQKDGSYFVFAEPNESFAELSSWPQNARYYGKSGWRYRPFYKAIQYWRKENENTADTTLKVRVNGRAKYWAVGSRNEADYVPIPGGVAFENFEMRCKYKAGQKFYYGITLKSADSIRKELK